MVITPRDLDILRWIGRHGLVTTAHIQRHFAMGEWAAYRRVRALVSAGLLQRDAVFWKQAHVLRLTPGGARLAAEGLAPAGADPAAVKHSLAVVTLSDRLLAQHPHAAYRTEREIRAAQLRQWRDKGRRPKLSRIPDGVLLLAPDERVAIELDLTTKRTREVERVIEAYVSHFSREVDGDGYARVWWYVLPDALSRVRTCVAAGRAEDVIHVEVWHDDNTA